ncbi:MAG: hypothetical protein Q8P81_01210, partial [Nanoarchaeota archaeon]|nr:hypothetical protein [Nanoarchaeota archaeon]
MDDTENPTPGRGENPEPVIYDEHGQRVENREPEERTETQENPDRYQQLLIKLAKQNQEVHTWDPEFGGDWIQYFSKHISPKEARVFNALYSPESFAEFVTQIREEIIQQMGYTESQVNSDREKKTKLDKELSKTLERRIVMSIGKLYIKVDEKQSNETFQEIETSNFMNSIRTSYDIIQDKIGLLKKELKSQSRSGELPESLKNLTFYKKYSEESVVSKKVKRDGKPDKLDFDSRPVPTPKSVPADIDEFLRYTSAQVTHFVELRRYLHDITVLFKRGPGQEGFWSQVSEFAKQITTSDIDSMLLLPDSELFMTAHSLYIKHLTALMARNSWTHKPGMFSADFFEINSDTEKRVLEDLRRLFPDVKDEDSERFQRAVKMGVGLARGVTLAEVEIAASADPPYMITPDGKREVSFESLYISDAAPLLAFRGTYNAERFLPRDMTEGPLLYAPVSNFKKRRFWNHNELWERMKEYEKSYNEGRNAINIKDDTELLIDAAMNFGKVGGIEFRSGWRLPRGYSDWLRTVTDADGENRGRLDYLESWKQLENIGFQAINNFVVNGLNHIEDGKDFLLGKREWRKGEREAFCNYLYDKYINFDPTTGGRLYASTLDQEISRLKEKVKRENPKKSDEDIEHEAYKLLVSKALFGLLRQRL